MVVEKNMEKMVITGAVAGAVAAAASYYMLSGL